MGSHSSRADCGPAAEEREIALAGNPNVGKSTVFNALTGLRQHTGNWPGKTVVSARGRCVTGSHGYTLVDLPGTYSLMAHSAEEEVARDYICFGGPEAVIVVCDATCLERNLNLLLQTMEMTPRVLLCVNLLDEARRRGMEPDLPLLSRRLGIPVVGVTARSKKGLPQLMRELDRLVDGPPPEGIYTVDYGQCIEHALRELTELLKAKCAGALDSRWLALKLLEGDGELLGRIDAFLGQKLMDDGELSAALERSRKLLAAGGIESADALKDRMVKALSRSAEELCAGAAPMRHYSDGEAKADRLLTGRLTGYPLMLLLLAVVFWLTIVGANYPSALLSDLLFRLQDRLTELFIYINAPDWLHGMLVLGVYRVLAWVVSVMLPPMAIFFPMFTLLEDAGYLPRVAYNLDKPFKRCRACGKQALCMCMGFGCNAAGVVGCRIIDSPRERLLAVLTNSFVPCNGRFPTLIAIITMFFAGSAGRGSSLKSALLLTAVIAFSVAVTLLTTRLLSATLLKGTPSSFVLELPPYRAPQVGRVIVRSIFDRTLFVLGRAAAVAAPAGLVIWLMANVSIDGVSLLRLCADILDPLGRLMGMDGVILMAFILGFPANEIVMPIIIMAYLCQGSLAEMESLVQLRALLTANGWTWATAVSVMLFSLNHWPCSTTLLTIKKETGSRGWTVLAALLPTVVGMALCIVFTALVRLL